MDENADSYSRVGHETGELIKVLTGNKALENYGREENKDNKNSISKETEGDEWNMCQAFEDYKMDSIREGSVICAGKVN